MNLVLGNLWPLGGLIQKIMPKLNLQMGGMLGTICGFSKIEGDGKRCTVVISFKAVGEADIGHDLDALRESAVKCGVGIAPPSEYHRLGDMGQPAFAYTSEHIGKVFPDYPAVPFILPAGTDARWLTDICPCVLRFALIRLSTIAWGNNICQIKFMRCWLHSLAAISNAGRLRVRHFLLCRLGNGREKMGAWEMKRQAKNMIDEFIWFYNHIRLQTVTGITPLKKRALATS